MKLEIADLSSIEDQIAELVRKKQEVLAKNRAEDVGIVVLSEVTVTTRAKKGTGKKQITAKDRASRKLVTVCVPNTDETMQIYLNEDGSFTRVNRGKAPRVFESKIKDGTIGEWVVATESEDANAEPLAATSESETTETPVSKTKKSSKK